MGEKQGKDGGEFQEEMENFVEGISGLFDSLKDIFVKSKEEVVRGAHLGKVRIDIFQLRKDREHFLQRLGEEAFDLIVAGAIGHEELERPFEKIRAIDGKIAACEADIVRMAAEQNAAEQSAAEAAGPAVEAEVLTEAAPAPQAKKKAAPKKAADAAPKAAPKSAPKAAKAASKKEQGGDEG